MTTSVLTVAPRLVHGGMAALFGYAIYVQHNDVDPFVWIPVYGIAAVFSGLAAAGRPCFSGPAIVAAVTLAWGIRMVPGVLVAPSLGDSVVDTLVDSEEGREMLGLFLVAGWMTVIAVGSRRGHAAGARSVSPAEISREPSRDSREEMP